MSPRGISEASVFVTGAASGIGRATARCFADNGCRVTIVDRDEEGLRETAALIEREGAPVRAAAADVSDAAELRSAYDLAVDSFGPPTIAFNNAGIEGDRVPIPDHPDSAFERTIAINLGGIWNCMKLELPAMVEAGGGCIVNTASALGLVGITNQPAYVASKHAVVGLTRAAALDHIGAGVRINCICPGLVATPMLTDRALGPHPELRDIFLDAQPIGRFAEPEEVARTVVWLCSDEASFIVGHALPVDGGYLAR